MQDGYPSPLVEKLAGITSRQLLYWRKTGLVSPSVAVSWAPRVDHRWSFTDIVAIRTIAQLRQSGISLQGVRKAAQWFQSFDPSRTFADVWLTSDGKDVYERSGDTLTSLIRKPGQHAIAWIIDLGDIAQQVEEELKIA